MEHSTTEFSLVCKFCGSPNAFSAEASSAELRCRSCQRLLCPDEDLPQVPGHEIIARLGEGGCGAVYLAREVKLTRLVAIKVMHATTGAPGLLERFEREARAIARLEHAGIIRVYTTGSFGNVPYMAMQYVPGHPLSEWIEKKKISTPDCIRILEKVARAVHHAHQQGVVHRDLKPANILVTPKLEPYVADFGLAKLLDETGKLTKTGVVVGTPLYMAPEQVRSDHGSIGQATDVYSLGAILFEALFGTPPFHQATLSRLYQAILQDDPIPPPNSCVHRDLESICMKALCKAPEGRYASAEAFAEDLKRYLSGEPVSVRASTTMMRARRLWRRNRRRAVAGSVLAVVLLAVAVTVSVLVGSRRKNAARAQAEVPYQEALKMLEQYEANPEGVGEDLLTTAEEALGNALAFDADFAAAYRERARCLSWQGRWGRAEEDFARSLQLDPEAAQTYLTRARVLLGRYLVELGPPKLVASPASVEIELPAPNPEARRLADATLRDLQFASEKFAKGSTPSSWEPALAKGVVALFEDRHGDAVSLLREAARGAPGVAEIPLFLGLSEFAQGHLDDAASAFEKALQFRPQYFDGLVYAAHAKVLQFMKAPSPKPREYERRLDDALRWMIQAKSGRRATWRTYYACGAFHVAAAAFWHPDEVAHARCDLRAHGIEDLQRAEKMAPGELEPVVCQVWASEDAAKCAVARKEDPRAVLTVGEGAIDRLQARRHQLPIRDLNLIGNFYGAVSVIERERGDVDRARGLLESAIRYHEQVVVAVPDEPYALYQLGVKFDDLRALTQDPEKKKGLQDRAERAWGRLVDLHVFLDWAYDRRGKIYQERAEQDPGRAVEWLRRAVAEHERRVRAFPDQPGFRKDLEAVEALLKAKRGS